MRKRQEFNWNDAAKLAVILKDGRKIMLGEEDIKAIVSALTLAAVHGWGSLKIGK